MTPGKFEFGFVPEAALVRTRAFIHPSTTIPDHERVQSWGDGEFSDLLAEKFSGLLPGPCSVDPGQMRWGSPDGLSIGVFFEREKPIGVTVTIDVRVPYIAFISELSLLANRLQWLVVMPDGRIFRPRVRRFLAEIQHCQANLWVRRSPADGFVVRRTLPG